MDVGLLEASGLTDRRKVVLLVSAVMLLLGIGMVFTGFPSEAEIRHEVTQAPLCNGEPMNTDSVCITIHSDGSSESASYAEMLTTREDVISERVPRRWIGGSIIVLALIAGTSAAILLLLGRAKPKPTS